MRECGPEGGFFLRGGAQSCLLLGDPRKAGRMRALGEALNESGFSVSAPDYAGECETSGPPGASNWRSWLDSAREAYARLDRAFESVCVVGFSIGGALAVVLAAEYPVKAVALIAPALRPQGRLGFWVYRHSPGAQDDPPEIGGIPDPAGAPAREGQFPPAVGVAAPEPARGASIASREAMMMLPPVRPRDVRAIARLARRSLFAVVAPILIVQPEKDEAAHPSGAKLALSSASSREKDVLWLTQSRHECLEGPRRALVVRAIKSHLCREPASKTLEN